MPKPAGNFPYDDRQFNKGANLVLDSELVGKQKEGTYLDATNFRCNSIDGSFAVGTSISGEYLQYPSMDNSAVSFYTKPYFRPFSQGQWVNMAACVLTIGENKSIVELWADELGNLPPFIRIDGVIVCANALLPIDTTHPIQIHVDNTVDSPKFAFTNNFNTPIMFDALDMITPSFADKYFDSFDIDLYTVQLKTYPHVPTFVKLTNDSTEIGIRLTPPNGNSGLVVGQYSYRTRYVSDSGDKAALSLPTPLIPVAYNIGLPSHWSVAPFPNTFAYGAAPTTQSPNAIVLKLRVENRLNYEYVEVYRYPYIGGSPEGYTPTPILAGRIPVSPGEMSVMTIIDYGGDEGTLTEEEDTDTPRTIKAAKTLRFADNRLSLMNITYVENEVSDDIFVGYDKTFHVMEMMGKNGHADAYHAAYHRSFMGGERYGLALVVFDSYFQRSFAIPLPDCENLKFPNRRYPASAVEKKYSYHAMPQGYPEDGVNQPTDTPQAIFERFSLKAGVNKVESADIQFSIVEGNYFPMRPTAQGDDVSNHSTKIIDQVTHTVDTWIDFDPKVYGEDYYALGIALQGIDVSKLPDWAASFTIVRTKPAGRVVAQGMGFYDMEGDDKLVNSVVFYSPELDSVHGIVDYNAIDFNIVQAEIVGSYGFTGEVYGHNALGSDLAIYAKIINDTGDINYGGVATHGGSVVKGQWRNTDKEIANPWEDKKYDVDINLYSGDMTVDRGGGVRSETFRMSFTNEDIYSTHLIAGAEYDVIANWHEPLYLFNLVNEGNNVPDMTVATYVDTGCYVKLRSCIGQYSGAREEYELVDERWEDCISTIENCDFYDTHQERPAFIYIKTSAGIQRWLNVKYWNPNDVTPIIDDLGATGKHLFQDQAYIYGIYSNTNTDNRFFSIIFPYTLWDGTPITPVEGEEIWVYYDNTMPVRVFGGDAFVGNTTWCPIDTSQGYQFNKGMPYNLYKYHTNYDSLTTETSTGTIIQAVCLYVSESRINQHMLYELNDYTGRTLPIIEKCFPWTNYIIRSVPGGETIDPLYNDDYPYETEWSEYGGFRFMGLSNYDYSHRINIINYLSKPDVGYTSKTHFPCRVHYSLEVVPGISDSPGLRTFQPGNYFDIPENHGEITFAWNTITEKGANIYCFTDYGVGALLIGKEVLAQADGTELATILGTQGQYIGGFIWVDEKAGMPYEMWRSKAEYGNLIFFSNKESVYAFDGSNMQDIIRDSYLPKLMPIFDAITGGYDRHITGGFDTKYREYWLQIESPTEEQCYVFSLDNKAWNGVFTHKYDHYVSFDNNSFGIGNKAIGKKALTDKLDEGNYIARRPIETNVTNVSSPFIASPFGKDISGVTPKEFIRIRITSNDKPDIVEFFNYLGQTVQARLSLADSNYYLKDYGNFEQYIPRKLPEADPERFRMQGRQLIYKLTHIGGGFVLKNVGIQYKELK